MPGPSEAPAQPPATARLIAAPSQIAIIDGATLRIGNSVVTLDGITPSARGSCHLPDGAGQDCGAAAANMLAAPMRNALQVACVVVHGHDDMGRALATCDARGTDLDLSRALVRAGLARATGAQASFRVDEAQARADGRGIWATR